MSLDVNQKIPQTPAVGALTPTGTVPFDIGQYCAREDKKVC